MARPIPVEQPVMSARFEVMAATVLDDGSPMDRSMRRATRPTAACRASPGLSCPGDASRCGRAAADVLGLRIVRRFEASMFGAALVEGRGDEPLVLKASLDLTLAREWATGAAMAARLRVARLPRLELPGDGHDRQCDVVTAVGATGTRPSMFTVGHAEQLIALACRHDIDAGERRPWDELAREASWRALAELEPLPDRFDETLRGAARRHRGPLPRADRPSCTATSTTGTSSWTTAASPASSTGTSQARVSGASTSSTSRSRARCTRRPVNPMRSQQ